MPLPDRTLAFRDRRRIHQEVRLRRGRVEWEDDQKISRGPLVRRKATTFITIQFLMDLVPGSNRSRAHVSQSRARISHGRTSVSLGLASVTGSHQSRARISHGLASVTGSY